MKLHPPVGTVWNTKLTTIRLLEGGILLLDPEPGAVLDAEVFDQQREVMREAFVGFPDNRGCMVAQINGCRATPDGRAAAAAPETTALLLSSAMVVNSRVGAMMANFWMRVNRPAVDNRVFTTLDEAHAHLLQALVNAGVEPYR